MPICSKQLKKASFAFAFAQFSLSASSTQERTIHMQWIVAKIRKWNTGS
jgi:hypothetical protein